MVKSVYFSSRGSLLSSRHPCQTSYKCLQLQLGGFDALVLGSESITPICSNTDTLKYTYNDGLKCRQSKSRASHFHGVPWNMMLWWKTVWKLRETFFMNENFVFCIVISILDIHMLRKMVIILVFDIFPPWSSHRGWRNCKKDTNHLLFFFSFWFVLHLRTIYKTVWEPGSGDSRL